MAGTKPRKGRIPKGSASPTAGSSPISDIYREMLAEVVSSSPTRFSEEGKAVKRRRIGGKVISRHDGGTSGHDTEQSSVLAEDTDSDNHISEKAIPRQQTAYNDSDDSPESDMDWEEVGLRKDGVEETAEEDVEDEKPMELVLDTGDVRSPRRGTARRKPSTAIEKKMRLEVHKTHLLCLLAHVHIRNNWCDDVEVQVNRSDTCIECW